ncbi:2561_t:CDS:2, partial [Racocetra persica]
LHPNVKPILPKGSTIYHVSKEFGTATMDGLGHNVSENLDTLSVNPPQLRKIWVYLFGPATNHPPFDLAFQYSETPLFARLDNRVVDVVHLHGATNAFVIDFLKELYNEDQYSKPSPPI